MARKPSELMIIVSARAKHRIDEMEKCIDRDMEARWRDGEFLYKDDTSSLLTPSEFNELQRRYDCWSITQKIVDTDRNEVGLSLSFQPRERLT